MVGLFKLVVNVKMIIFFAMGWVGVERFFFVEGGGWF